jgi:hypothetical protein
MDAMTDGKRQKQQIKKRRLDGRNSRYYRKNKILDMEKDGVKNS